MKTKKLQVRIMLIVGSAVTIIFALVVLSISIRANKIIVGDALHNTEEKATSYAESIEKLLDYGLISARTLASSLEGYSSIPIADRRNVYAKMLEQAMSLNVHFKSVWVTLEPNALDNNDVNNINTEYSNEAGRFVATFYKENEVIKKQIVTEEETLTADYYQIPKKREKEVIIEPYKYKYSENGTEYNLSSICIPMKDINGKFMGVVGIDIDLSELQDFINKEKQIMAVFSNEGQVVAHFDPSRIGKKLVDTEADMLGIENVNQLALKIKNSEIFSLEFYASALKSKAFIVVAPIKIGDTDQSWGFGYAEPLNVAYAKAKGLQYLVLIIAIAGLAALLIILYFLIKGISTPIVETARYAGKIANGDLTATINIKRDDEVGQLANSLSEMGQKLKEIISGISDGASNIASSSEQLNSASQQLAESANEQASSVEEISSTMEQMAANISSNTDNARQTEQISIDANNGIMEVAERSGRAVEANKTILEKITVINDIAFQTNILALNAAVEAARAGEHGKGFAVVAAEVRKLAEKSKIAAEEIVKLTNDSYNLATGAGEVMMTTIPKVQKTTKLIQEISASSMEQDNGANQVNSAIQQLNHVTQQNAASSEQLSSSAEELSAQAEQLKELVSYFVTMDEATINKKKIKSQSPARPYRPVAKPSLDIRKVKQPNMLDNEFESF